MAQANSTRKPASLLSGVQFSLILVIVCLAYINGIRGGFVWEDQTLIVHPKQLQTIANVDLFFTNSYYDLMVNPGEDQIGGAIGIYRPMVAMLTALTYEVFGPDPSGFHVVSLMLHLVCVALLYLISVRLSSQVRLAASAALFLGLNPAVSGSVYYASGVANPLALMFVLSAFLVLNRASTSGTGSLGATIASAGLWGLALFSKEVVLVLLPLFPVFSAMRRSTAGIAGSRKVFASTLICFAAVAILYLIIRSSVTHLIPMTTETNLTLAARMPYLIVRSVILTLVPIYTSPDYLWEHFDAQSTTVFGIAWLGLMVVSGCLFVLRTRWKWEIFFSAGACLLICPIVYITMANGWFGLGRFLYLPSAFFAIVFGLVVARLSVNITRMRHQFLLSASLIVYFGSFFVGTAMASNNWYSSESLYRAMAIEFPDKSHGYGSLGYELSVQGRYQEAIEVLSQAVQINPLEFQWQANLARAYLATGDGNACLDVLRATEKTFGSDVAIALLRFDCASIVDIESANQAGAIMLRRYSGHSDVQRRLRRLEEVAPAHAAAIYSLAEEH